MLVKHFGAFFIFLCYTFFGGFMTFSTKLKEEICNEMSNRFELESELSAILRFDSKILQDKIVLTFENGSVARRVFRSVKEITSRAPHIIVRNQKRLRSKQIYILEIKEQVNVLLQKLNITKDFKWLDMRLDYLTTKEEMAAFVRGAFLVVGSINDPSTSGYHLEYVFNFYVDAVFVNELLHEMKFDSKVLERNNKYMVYLKSAEEISDMIRLFQAPQSLFYFEDIRIYRDHKNMVNRLNNCEIANQEKSTSTGLRQVEDIHFLEEHDLLDLLDEKVKIVLEYRLKYPECSYQELADIIALETDYQIGKSGINHHFIKIKKLIQQYQNNKKIKK